VDVLKVENQSLKAKVKSLQEKLTESNVKFRKLSSVKPAVEPISMSVPTEPSNSKKDQMLTFLRSRRIIEMRRGLYLLG
jgi:uncharacterized protein YoxC